MVFMFKSKARLELSMFFKTALIGENPYKCDPFKSKFGFGYFICVISSALKVIPILPSINL